MSDPDVALGHVILPADDLDEALRFLTEVVGARVRFRDGDRYAALDLGGGTLALASPDEQPTPGEIAIGLKVADVDALEARLQEAGAQIDPAGTVASGHERRLTFRNRDGVTFVAYAPMEKP